MATKTKNILTWVLGIALLVSLAANAYFLTRTDSLERQNAIYYQNYVAATDSLRTYQLDNGELLVAQKSYILETDELKQKLHISEKEYKDIEKKLNSTIQALTVAQGQVRIDTITIPGEPIIKSDTLVSRFAWGDDWLTLRGVTEASPSHSKTTIYNIMTGVPLTVGMTEDYQLFATTPNPYVTFTNITPALNSRLIPKKKRWSIGLSGGFGVMYGLNAKKFEVGPYIGVGIGYKLVEF